MQITLTPSEAKLMELLLQGKSLAECTEELKVHRATAHTTIRKVCTKAGVDSSDSDRIDQLLVILKEEGYMVLDNRGGRSLTDEQILLIKDLAAKTKDNIAVSQASLAQRFGVSEPTISRLLKNFRNL